MYACSLLVEQSFVVESHRLLVDKDIYRRALQAGVTSHPGADVEDRQYQLDVVGWSLSTGRCQLDITQGLREKFRCQRHGIISQQCMHYLSSPT